MPCARPWLPAVLFAALAAPPSLADTFELSVLTYNVAGLP